MSNVVKLEIARTDRSEKQPDEIASPAPSLTVHEGHNNTDVAQASPELEAPIPVELQVKEASNSEDSSTSETSSPATPTPKQPELPALKPAPSPVFTFVRFLWLTIASSCALAWYIVSALVRYAIRHPFNVLANAIMLIVLGVMIVTGSEIHSQLILGRISDQTIDAVIEGSRFTRTYDADEVTRSGGREFLNVGAPVWTQREAVRAILFHARKAGLSIEDQAVLLAIVDIESGFNPTAHAPTTTACGLFQFVKRTGEIFGLSQSECMDPWKNAQAGIAHFLYNYERRVSPAVKDLQGAEKLFKTYELSYYLHHDGPESQNPSNDVKAIILNGSSFLFKAHRALQEEATSSNKAPSFAEQFFNNLVKLFDRVRGIAWRHAPIAIFGEAPDDVLAQADGGTTEAATSVH